MSKKAIGYVRVSTEGQVSNGESLDLQADAIRAYCQSQDLELVDLIVEGGVSGYIPLADRSGGGCLPSVLSKREVGHVVTLKLDRMFRRASDALEQTAAWDKSGVGLHVLNMGGSTVNTATAVGRVFLSMLAVFAEFERNITSERTREALAAKRKRRERISGELPFGYQLSEDDIHLEPESGEQDTLVWLFRLRAKGLSLRSVAEQLNKRGHTTRAGSAWRHQYVANILKSAQKPPIATLPSVEKMRHKASRGHVFSGSGPEATITA